MKPLPLPTALLLIISLHAQAGHAQSAPSPRHEMGPARPGDSIWMVDTREVTQPTAADPGMALRVYRDGRWEERRLESLHGELSPHTRTVLFVHGYDFSPEQAERTGWALYHTLTDQIPPGQRLQLITWSWPSTSIKFRVLRDMKAKMRRAHTEAYFLAWFLSRVNVDTVIGTSMGARIVSGALQFLAGDAETLNTAIGRAERQAQLTAVLISAALDVDWLEPNQTHGEALSQVKQLVLLNNSLDPVLANFSIVAGNDALGRVGLSHETLSAWQDRVAQHDLATAIGQRHGVENYLQAAVSRDLLQGIVLAT